MLVLQLLEKFFCNHIYKRVHFRIPIWQNFLTQNDRRTNGARKKNEKIN